MIPITEVPSFSATITQSVNGSNTSEISDKCGESDNHTTELTKKVGNLMEKSYKNSTDENNSYAGNKNAAEGLMDIALLSANANQLRFLITYNHDASTFYVSISLVAVSLIMQIMVGIALIFKRRFRRCRSKRYNELILGGVFIITVVNILLAAFTTTDAK
ncbi:hypothetical protein DOY81_004116 [Sarcophaga bullata]|nr:hypothetical protein DOY81_004116 [Sarcophaga bullata]